MEGKREEGEEREREFEKENSRKRERSGSSRMNCSVFRKILNRF